MKISIAVLRAEFVLFKVAGSGAVWLPQTSVPPAPDRLTFTRASHPRLNHPSILT
jgi:hypothetical protein